MFESVKARLHDATKTCDMRQKHASCDKNMRHATKTCDVRQKHATCDKIVLRLLHAAARKLNDFNFPETACNSRTNKPV